MTIITMEANSLIRPLHNRMPVIFSEEDWPKWLWEETAAEGELKAMLKPYPSDQKELWPFDRKVGNFRNDGPELVQPVVLTEHQGDLGSDCPLPKRAPLHKL
jgi:putative SOS response-associated peptidase YedK